MVIENELNLFIGTEENNGALLITGKWGCGKSYLVKKCVEDINSKNEYAIAIISLFGVDTIESLNSRVRDAYLEFTSSVFGKKAQKVLKTIKKVAKDSTNITAAALPQSAAASAVSMGVSSVLSFNPLSFINVKNTVGKGDKQRTFGLVFDDLERCTINKIDLLGAINEYAENKDIKVIIIADEEKIAGDEYKEFKEKVITRTLKMSSNYPEIINSIIDKYRTNNDNYKAFLAKSKECIIGAFLHSGYNNLRTLKSCIMDFERIYDVCYKVGVAADHIEPLFYKFCAIAYETKKGNYSLGPYGLYMLVTGENDQEKRESIVNEIKSKYLDDAFDFIPNGIPGWVVLGEWDSQTIESELKRIYTKAEITHEEKFIQYHFWDLEQSDIDYGMPALVERAYSGDATRDELITLLQKTHALKTHKIPIPCEVDYQKIDQGLDKRSEDIKKGITNEPKRRTFTENHQIDKEAISLYEKIERMDNRMAAWEYRRLLLSYLKGDANVSVYRLKNICVEAFDDELQQLFTKIYLASDNEKRTEVCRVLLNVEFNNVFYSTPIDLEVTITNLEKVISIVKELYDENSGTIDNAIHGYVIKNLEQLVDKISLQDNE